MKKENVFPYIKAKIEDGEIIVEEIKMINQAILTSDCFMVQFEGLKACSMCEFRGTKECGGGKTLERKLSEKE